MHDTKIRKIMIAIVISYTVFVISLALASITLAGGENEVPREHGHSDGYARCDRSVCVHGDRRREVNDDQHSGS